MNPVALHGVAGLVLRSILIGWGVLILLRDRHRGRRHRLEWTQLLVVGCVAAAGALGYFGAHTDSTVLNGGWAHYGTGVGLLVAGLALRTWAIVTLGRFF